MGAVVSRPLPRLPMDGSQAIAASHHRRVAAVHGGRRPPEGGGSLLVGFDELDDTELNLLRHLKGLNQDDLEKYGFIPIHRRLASGRRHERNESWMPRQGRPVASAG